MSHPNRAHPLCLLVRGRHALASEFLQTLTDRFTSHFRPANRAAELLNSMYLTPNTSTPTSDTSTSTGSYLPSNSQTFASQFNFEFTRLRKQLTDTYDDSTQAQAAQFLDQERTLRRGGTDTLTGGETPSGQTAEVSALSLLLETVNRALGDPPEEVEPAALELRRMTAVALGYARTMSMFVNGVIVDLESESGEDEFVCFFLVCVVLSLSSSLLPYPDGDSSVCTHSLPAVGQRGAVSLCLQSL